MSNEPTTVTLNGTDYAVRPINIVNAIRLTNMVKGYLARSSAVVQQFMSGRNSEQSVFEQAAGVLTAINELVPDERFESDLLTFFQLISGVPKDELSNISADELLESLPAIIEASRISAILRRLYAQIGGIAPSLNGAMTQARAVVETAAGNVVPLEPEQQASAVAGVLNYD